MKIVIGSDHAGLELKRKVKDHLEALGHQVDDVGPYDSVSVHYPVYAIAAAKQVRDKVADMGIVICSSGEGIMIAANKVRGIRCGIAYSDEVAKLMKEHNNCNMIAFGQNTMNHDDVLRRLDIFMNAEYQGGRHQNRLDIIDEYEKNKS